MYSTLSHQKNLVRVHPDNKLYFYALISWIHPSGKFYLVVRNPFNRIVSFYKSKFVRAERTRLWMLEKGNGNWQKCTEHFFPYLNLTTKTEPCEVSKKLSSTKFEEVISILPNVYKLDGHMIPQCNALKFSFKKYGLRYSIPINYRKTFKIENAQDLKKLEEIFDIDLSIRKNNTDQISEDAKWNVDSVKIVANVYKTDLKKFNYKQIPDSYA